MSISTSYWTTVWRWLRGWGRFGEIRFKPGWSARSPASQAGGRQQVRFRDQGHQRV